MKKIVTSLLFSLPVFILFLPFTLPAQDLTGIWRGYFHTEDYDEYKFELQIEQKNTSIAGVSYSYLNTVFYGKATLTGRFSKTSQNALIQEIKTVELRMSLGSTACIMKCSFDYYRSGKEEFLEGTFVSYHEETDSLHGRYKRGDDCGGGTVYLRRVTTSDFYVEPFLRNYARKQTEKTDPPKTNINTNPNVTIKKPPPTTQTNENVKKTPPSSTTQKPVISPRIDSIEKIEKPLVKKEPPNEIIRIPDVLNSRSNELVKTLVLSDPDITIKIYDNGEIDDDTVSVYLNKKLVLSKKRLSYSPIILKIKMDEENTDHELIMVAENLGRIPPNTSLMIVEAGDKRYDVRITSTEQKNAVIRFKYQKPK